MFNRIRTATLPFLAAGAMAMQGVADLPSKHTAPLEKRQEAIIRRKNEPGNKYKARKRRSENRLGYKANRQSILAWWAKFRGKDSEAFDLIQNMTNWRNHQWRKAGGKRDLETVKAFAALTRPTKNVGGVANG